MGGGNRYYRRDLTTKSNAGTVCIFISHRSADLSVAMLIGQYLKDEVGVDIYLAESDRDLQSAFESNSHAKIVEYIENGLRASTHLLGLVSSTTCNSWWVPFEFGAARQRNLSIATLLLEDVTEAPSYLRIADVLQDQADLASWIFKATAGFRKSTYVRPLPQLNRVARMKSEKLRWR